MENNMKKNTIYTFLWGLGTIFIWFWGGALGIFETGWFGLLIAIGLFIASAWYNFKWIQETGDFKKKLARIGFLCINLIISLYLIGIFYTIYIKNESILH